MISDDDVQRALDWLHDHSELAAKARADRLHMEAYTSVVKARLMGQSNHEKVNAQERHALAHPEYETHLVNLQTAIEKDEMERFKLKAAEATIEAWRSFQANQRVMGKIV